MLNFIVTPLRERPILTLTIDRIIDKRKAECNSRHGIEKHMSFGGRIKIREYFKTVILANYVGKRMK